jgi:hypothetical protein
MSFPAVLSLVFHPVSIVTKNKDVQLKTLHLNETALFCSVLSVTVWGQCMLRCLLFWPIKLNKILCA